MRTNPNDGRAGSALAWTVIIIALLSLGATEVLRLVTLKYQSALQTATWQESLLAAESGVDLAIAELRKSLYPAPNHAWESWNTTPGDQITSHTFTTLSNAGFAGTPMTVEANVDAPAQLIDPVNSWQYYRIRTVGTMPVPGVPRVGDNKQDNRLRKLSLRWERFSNGILVPRALSAPQVSRRIEAIVRPVSSFANAILSIGTLDLTNQNIVIDSYDSRDPTKSTNGLYDVNKRQENGDIATNGNIIDAGNAHIYGDVGTNAGTVTGAANITGVERTDFYQEPIPIGTPTWLSINPSPATVVSSTTLNASDTRGSPSSRYILATIGLSGSQTLTVAGNPDGSPTYIEIQVLGDISVTGQAEIVLEPGVNATIYFSGNVDVSGKGIINSNNQPGDLLMYGIEPIGGTTPHVSLGGNAQLSAALYAPGHNVTVAGGGSSGHVYGSIVGKTVVMTGVTNLHYDEALASVGLINNYKIVSWFEDNR